MCNSLTCVISLYADLLFHVSTKHYFSSISFSGDIKAKGEYDTNKTFNILRVQHAHTSMRLET